MRIHYLACVLVGWAAIASSQPVHSQDLMDALGGGRWFADIRLRSESVRDQGFAEDALANTLRTRIGYETARFHGFHILLEGENVSDIGAERFDDTVNGRTNFPVVADPDGTELNQGYLHYQPLSDLFIRAGRQRIIFDNHRFIGNVGFRQNEQTYDAVMLGYQGLWNTALEAGYIFNANSFVGDDAVNGNLRSKSAFLRASRGITGGDVTGYLYLIDLAAQPQASSATVGLRYTGAYRFLFNRDFAALYTAEYARQWDYGGNPASFGLDYWFVEPGLEFEAFTGKVGFESLAGDGVSALQTPLATGHAFNGITDIFVVTPPDGIRDLYATVSLDLGRAGLIDGAVLEGALHRFWAERNGKTYGSEASVTVTKTFDGVLPLGASLSVSAEYASYWADSFGRDTEKIWLTGRIKR